MKKIIPLLCLLSISAYADKYTKSDPETGSFTKKIDNLYVKCEYNHNKFIEGRLIFIKNGEIITVGELTKDECDVIRDLNKRKKR